MLVCEVASSALLLRKQASDAVCALCELSQASNRDEVVQGLKLFIAACMDGAMPESCSQLVTMCARSRQVTDRDMAKCGVTPEGSSVEAACALSTALHSRETHGMGAVIAALGSLVVSVQQTPEAAKSVRRRLKRVVRAGQDCCNAVASQDMDRVILACCKVAESLWPETLDCHFRSSLGGRVLALVHNCVTDGLSEAKICTCLHEISGLLQGVTPEQVATLRALATVAMSGTADMSTCIDAVSVFLGRISGGTKLMSKTKELVKVLSEKPLRHVDLDDVVTVLGGDKASEAVAIVKQLRHLNTTNAAEALRNVTMKALSAANVCDDVTSAVNDSMGVVSCITKGDLDGAIEQLQQSGVSLCLWW